MPMLAIPQGFLIPTLLLSCLAAGKEIRATLVFKNDCNAEPFNNPAR
ncbi:MAG: hypothetical protein LC754_09335 [Acidobacteria bacterium]|nr:hypothetical protein [Acidobacteriota bacterium]